MLPNRTAIALCALSLCALALPSAAEATLITYFNFNQYDAPTHGNDFTNTQVGGSGDESRIRLFNSDGTPWQTADLSDGSGTNLNEVGSESPNRALSLDNAGLHDLGYLQLDFDATGYGDIDLSFAIRAATPGNAEFDILSSTDGWMSHTIESMNNPIGSSYSVTLEELQNASTASVRLVFSGATNDNSTLIDNLQINGTGVPEAPAVAMMGVAVLLFGGVAYRRRRAGAGQSVPAQVLAV
jgi:hypothetical protein